MTMSSMDTKLLQISEMPAAARIDAFKAVATEAVAGNNFPHLKALLTHVLREEVPLSTSRPVLAHYALAIVSMDSASLADALEFSVGALGSRAASFPDANESLRKQLAEQYVEAAEFTKAARCLGRIDLDAGGRTGVEAQKAALFVRISELLLEDDDTVEAERYIKKASEIIHLAPDAHLQLRYRVSYARIQDSQKKFLEAALKYYQLSQIEDDTIEEDDILTLLVSAVTCACLAKAGPQRSRIMATLVRDARTPTLECFFMLDKMYREQLLKASDVAKFREMLQPHHMSELPGGMTVYDRAIVQHSLLAASRIYENITFTELGVLLALEPAKAERIASTMIAEGRLAGTIDQVDDTIVFESAKEQLTAWDARLKQLCGAVSRCSDEVEKRYPEIAP